VDLSEEALFRRVMRLAVLRRAKKIVNVRVKGGAK